MKKTTSRSAIPLRSSQKNTVNDENVEIRPSWRYSLYVLPDQLFLFGSIDGLLTYSFWKNRYESISNQQDYMSKNRGYSAAVAAGLGFGKVRDGRPVFQVLRYLEKIISDSSLIRPLERDEITSLVNLFARQSEYAGKYERYSKFHSL